MATSDLERLLDDWARAWTSNDPERVLALFADDGVFEDVTFGVVARGKEAIRSYASVAFAAVPDFKYEVRSRFAARQWAAIEWAMSGTHKGDFPGMPATGKRFSSVRGVTILELADDKIRRESDYWDAATLLKQVGLLPGPPMQRTAIYVPPDAGQSVCLAGDTFTLKLAGEQTGGAFALGEVKVPPRGGPPPHVHHVEDETFVVLEGELLFHVGQRTLPAPVGTVIYAPKGIQHAYSNVGSTPARMLFLFAPAGMERIFAEAGRPATPGETAPPPSQEDVAKLMAAATKYHVEAGASR